MLLIGHPVDVLEVFGGAAGVTRLAIRRKPHCGKSVDIRCGTDLTDPKAQGELYRYVRTRKPLFMIGGPPCGSLSSLSKINRDKFIETWKRRILFFKLNKTIIEVIEEKDKNETPEDKLGGLAWEVEDIVKKRDELVASGIDISEIKKGVKENTLVMTVKCHTHNVPTLFIQHM